jgi:hypothetical protein
MFAKLRVLAGLSGLAAILVLQGCGKNEQSPAPATQSAAPAAATAGAAKPVVESIIAKDSDTPPATAFAADIPKLYAFFRSTGTKQGDKFRGVWIAEDVGDAAPKETKIDEATLPAEKDDFNGAFSITKPNKGWPVGKYRAEIYVGDQLTSTAKFTIGD